VATVDDNGVVTGIGSGTALIVVKADGKSATATMKVLQPILSIIATPDSFDLPMTTQRTISYQLVGPGGQALMGRTVTWATSNPAVASVSATGVVTPISVGTVTVTIFAGDKSTPIRVRVVPEPVTSVRITPQQSVHIVRLGQGIQLTAQCLNASLQVLTGRTITWNSNNPLVATVTQAGAVSGVAIGQSTVTATCENTGSPNATGSAPIQVTPVPVASVSVSPSPVTLTVNWPGQQLTATPRDSANNVLSLQGRSVNWFSDNIPVASVSAQGVVTASNVGQAQVRVTVDGVDSPWIGVTVQNAAVATVTVSQPPQVRVGGQHTMGVTLKDAIGNTLTGRVVTWNSSNPAVASVDANGLVQALAAGQTQITATSEGITSHPVTLTVIP
jgi:uncharacterized protein YjdB